MKLNFLEAYKFPVSRMVKEKQYYYNDTWGSSLIHFSKSPSLPINLLYLDQVHL